LPSPPMTRSSRNSGGIFDEDIPNLADLVRFLVRHWWVLASLTVAGGLVVFLAVAFILPERYEASATLVVVPPRFSSNLKPEALTVQGYQRLLESDAVIGETVRRLIEQGVLEEGKGLSLGEQLSSRIFVSRFSEATSLAPVIEAQGRSRDPDKAAVIANTWSAVFLDRLNDLMTGSLLPSLDFINERYAHQTEEVESLEQERVALADDFQRRYSELMSSWDGRLEALKARLQDESVAYRQETGRLVAEQQAETRTVMQDLAGEVGLILKPETELAGAESPRNAVQDTLLQVLSLRTHLAQTSPVLILEKSISDDALWMTLTSDGRGTVPAAVATLGLRTQEANPLHGELSLRISELESRLQTLADGADDWTGVEDRLSRLETMQRERSRGLSGLQVERAAGLDGIRRRAATAVEEMERQRKRELDDLERQRGTAIAKIDRKLSYSKSLFDELAQNHNQASLAREDEEFVDVRLASRAVPPRSPIRPRLILKSIIGVLVGAFLGLLLAVIREVEDWGGRGREVESDA